MLWGAETGESAENPYTLSDLLRRPQLQLVDHREAYRAIMQWLVDVTQIPAESILIDHKIAVMEGCPLLWTSECKKPDLQIISANKCVLVQIEVDSGDMESTVRKLGMGLVDQLRWLRNHHRTSITKCSGFYSSWAVVEEVMSLLKFALERQRLPMGSVATKVKEVMGHWHPRSLASTVGRRIAGFALPISGNFIHTHFGAGAIQMPSGQSVVVANLHTGKVYKHCHSDADTLRLGKLQHLDRKPERSVFPESIKFLSNKYFLSSPSSNRHCHLK